MTKKIFVGAIPKQLSEEEFKAYFKAFGETELCQLMKRRGENQNRGFGFVKYIKEEDSEVVISKEHEIGGQKLTVNYSKVPMKEDSRRYFIGGINAAEISVDQLKEHFTRYGEVSDCFILEKKGYGFVELSNMDHKIFDQILNNTHIINNIKLDVQAAKSRPERRRQPPPYGAPMYGGWGQTGGYGRAPPGYGRGRGAYRTPYNNNQPPQQRYQPYQQPQYNNQAPPQYGQNNYPAF